MIGYDKNMEALISSLANFSLDNLEHDVDQIIASYENQLPGLDKSNLLCKVDVNELLFDSIITILKKKGYSNQILEIMPYIDDYFEYVFV